MPTFFDYWKYKYEIRVQNPPVATDVQVPFTVPYLRGMRSDFRDIRFTDQYGRPVKYYIESYTAWTSAFCWLLLPGDDTKIFLMFGNGRATSESSAADVFEFYDGFSSLDMSKYDLYYGSASVSGGVLSLTNPTRQTILESKETFPINSIVEIRASHQVNNRVILGFRSIDTEKSVAWRPVEKSTGFIDYKVLNNGSTDTWYSDATIRGGKGYFVYGVAHLGSSAIFYINYASRGTYTLAAPGNVSLPIQFYSEAALGPLLIDWVRVRKYLANPPVLTLGQKFILNPTGFFQTKEYFSDDVSISIDTESHVKDYFFDEVTVKIKTGFMVGQPDQVTDSVTVNCSVSDETIREWHELIDYALESCDVSKSISDTYMQLSASFANDSVPPEGATIKYYTHELRDDSAGFPVYTADGYPIYTADGNQLYTQEIIDGYILYSADGYPVATADGYYIYTTDYVEEQTGTLLFWGKVISKTPKLSYLGDSIQIQAADRSRNLAVQKIPWNYQIITLNETFDTWDKWISELIDSDNTGVMEGNIIDTQMPTKQFSFKPSVSRLDAINEIAQYMGCIVHTKLKQYDDTYSPTLYAVPASEIDQKTGGFDLPDPIEFTYPDPTIVDEPTIVSEQEEKYNKVIVYGVLSNTGETTVATAYTPAVHMGEENAREYIVEDNTIFEKGSTAEIEAIKWLLYFTAPRATVSMKFVQRFDLELYQRIRFGEGFSKHIKDLTNSEQLPYIISSDPREEIHSTHALIISGVPRPSWLRISEIKYHSAECEETCEIKAITDYIYSSADPVILPPYAQFIAPGYLKPVSDDTVSSVESIVEDTIEKQLSPEICTVLSKDEENRTMVVQTQSGKLVTVKW